MIQGTKSLWCLIRTKNNKRFIVWTGVDMTRISAFPSKKEITKFFRGYGCVVKSNGEVLGWGWDDDDVTYHIEKIACPRRVDLSGLHIKPLNLVQEKPFERMVSVGEEKSGIPDYIDKGY